MISRRLAVPALGLVLAAGCLMHGCQKEEETPVAPEAPVPGHIRVTATADTILTGGRDSAQWTLQLTQDGKPAAAALSLTLVTDMGYFKRNGTHATQTTVATDGSGRGTVWFFGGQEPGIAHTLMWGNAFGIDTQHTALLLGRASTMNLRVRDQAAGAWADTDTLRSGPSRAKADSTNVRVQLLDSKMGPVPGVRVELQVLSNGKPVLLSFAGYFRSTRNPGFTSRCTSWTDANGTVLDMFYSDSRPSAGTLDVQIVATADSCAFGRLVTTKYLLVKAP